MISAFLLNLGDLALEQTNYTYAEKHFKEGLQLAREIGHVEWTSSLLINLGIAIRESKAIIF